MTKVGSLDRVEEEPDMATPIDISNTFASCVLLHGTGEVICMTMAADVPSSWRTQTVERQVSGRYFITRNTARQLHKDLGVLLHAGKN
jgi:hypothetical protein